MLVAFQRVIYMGTPLRMRFQRIPRILKSPPPGSRTERLINVYPNRTPKGIHIEELSIPSSKPNTVRLSTLLPSAPPRHDLSPFTPFTCHRLLSRCVSVFLLLFVQISPRSATGNAGNPLHRIPVFTALLNAIPSLAIFAPAPRSYWTSSGAARPRPVSPPTTPPR